MESPTAPPVPQKGDFEVTGISRSGRVRKKSSKLMDFQSPDDIETRAKKGTPGKHPNIGKLGTPFAFSGGGNNDHHRTVHPMDAADSLNSRIKTDMEMMSLDFSGEHGESSESASDELMDETTEGETGENVIDPTVKQSIYMSEKSNKKKVMKDGKVVFGKAQRKDKGKSRVTAYMLWARDARKTMLSQQPDLDFASISRRLGDLWANVPTSVKYQWKRRAKQLVSKGNVTDRKDVAAKAPSKFLNKGQSVANNNMISNNSTNTLPSTPIGGHTAGGGGSSNRSKKHTKETDLMSSPNDSSDHHPPPNPTHNKKSNSSAHKISPTAASATAATMAPGSYKVTGIDPVDVAAHLKLLGDSLTIIGERLKEHEGQITVSGSLSVLLDSLLCSLGPLMCLSTQIPGLGGDKYPRLRESLQNTLDNIAYVMPGL